MLYIFIKKLILIILKSTTLLFRNGYYRRLTGTAMGTLVTPNCSNIFLGNFEQNEMHDYFQKKKVITFVMISRFFIWTGKKDLLDRFTSYSQ